MKKPQSTINNPHANAALMHAKQEHSSLFDGLVLRLVSGDELAIAGLKHLITMSAIEVNEKRGICH